VVEPWTPCSLSEVTHGSLTISHPGQWVAISLSGDIKISFVSIYGIFDRMKNRPIFADATLHRAISDLTWLLLSKKERIVIGGDFNIWQDYGRLKKRYQTIFDRLKAHGLDLAGPFNLSPLLNCPCNDPVNCRHVHTHRNRTSPEKPFQNDFIFSRGVKVSCAALNEERHWVHSDHCPILAEI
jgi:endonuclease/exonuclease/phosphatase family metal-dependent hydrolase